MNGFIISFMIVLIIGLGLFFGAPFIESLAPPNTIYLYDGETKSFIARGAETLWAQWQNWGYIALFVFLVSIVIGLTLNILQLFKYEGIRKLEQYQKEEIEKYKTLQTNYKSEVLKQYEAERKALDVAKEHLSNDTYNKHHKLKKIEQSIIIKEQKLNQRIRQMNAENKEKEAKTIRQLHQAKRLKKDKLQITNFLNVVDWTIDGEKLTYQALQKRAKAKKENNS